VNEIFLAFVLFAVPAFYPKVMPMKTLAECWTQADKLNKEDPDVQLGKDQKAEWACVVVVRRQV
jgi:hypothetical protein